MSICTKIPEPAFTTKESPKSKQATICFLTKEECMRNISRVIPWLPEGRVKEGEGRVKVKKE